MKSKFLISGVVIVAVAIAAFFVFIRDPYPVPADWKTYQNTQFGFEFKYPENFLICDLPRSLEYFQENLSLGLYGDLAGLSSTYSPPCDVTKVDPPNIEIFIVDADNNKSVEDLFLQKFPRARDAVNYSDIKYFKLGSLDAYGGEMKFGQGSEYGALVLKGSRLMIIGSPFYIYPPLPGQDLSTKSAVDGIISTLKLDRNSWK